MLYKFYRLIDIIRYEIPNFIRNIWKFRKALSEYYWYDYRGLLMFIETALLDKADKTETKGYEIDESRLKKVEKMRRAAEIIRNCIDDNYLELAEQRSGKTYIFRDVEFEPATDNPNVYQLKDNITSEEKENNRNLIYLSNEIELTEWTELMLILKGRNHEQFDGTGLKTWWD